MRPTFLPSFFGFESENAAHRFAVNWNDGKETKSGVYIPRRDTSSFFNSLIGGRLFPGVQFLSQFKVKESNSSYELSFNNKNDNTYLDINCEECQDFPKDNSMFKSLEDASLFFQNGSTGYSPAQNKNVFQSMQLKTNMWKVSPLKVNQVSSSYFNDETKFPKGSIHFDHALLMRNIIHSWVQTPKITP